MTRLKRFYRRLSHLGIPTEETLWLPAFLIVVLLHQSGRGKIDADTEGLLSVGVCAIAGLWLGSLTDKVGPLRALIRSWALAVLVVAGLAAIADETLAKREYLHLFAQVLGSLSLVFYMLWVLANLVRRFVLDWPVEGHKRALALQRQNSIRRLFGIKPKDTLLFSRKPVQVPAMPRLPEQPKAAAVPAVTEQGADPDQQLKLPAYRRVLEQTRFAFAISQGRVRRDNQKAGAVLLADAMRLIGRNAHWFVGGAIAVGWALWSGSSPWDAPQHVLAGGRGPTLQAPPDPTIRP